MELPIGPVVEFVVSLCRNQDFFGAVPPNRLTYVELPRIA
jgi:hypothetical protein